MTTVLRASPRRFVSTPAIERITLRALRYLQSGFSVHLRGPAGTGKTTLALHLADLLARPIMLVFGDDEAKSSDLIGSQSGYTRKKVVDNYIHTVMKVEDELKQNWVDSRLTLACREGFTLVYDEFNRSRPEVNNVLLSALEEKLLVLPPSSNQTEYIRVDPHFRAILTSNPEEYYGVHATQDALMDRLVTISMPEPDELTQQEILVQKTEIDRVSALLIVRLVKAFRVKTQGDKISGLRSGLVIAKVCKEHAIAVSPSDADFREICSDIMLSRITIPVDDATKILWQMLNELVHNDLIEVPEESIVTDSFGSSIEPSLTEISTSDLTVPVKVPEPVVTSEPSVAEIPTPDLTVQEQLAELFREMTELETEVAPQVISETVEHEQTIYHYLLQSGGVRLSQIESDLGLTRLQTHEAIRVLLKKGQVKQHDRLFIAQTAALEVKS